MSGERQQRWMETDGIPLPLQHGALEVVVEQDSGQSPAPGLERHEVAAQEVLHARIEEEVQEDLPRIAHDHDEGHQCPARSADGEMTEMSPVDLTLFT